MSIEDVLICKKCGNDLDIYEDVELNFDFNGEGFYSANCWCPDCNAYAKVKINFKYDITKACTDFWTK